MTMKKESAKTGDPRAGVEKKSNHFGSNRISATMTEQICMFGYEQLQVKQGTVSASLLHSFYVTNVFFSLHGGRRRMQSPTVDAPSILKLA
jgi:hypothetical protein